MMNKIRAFAIVSVCLLCLTAVVGTLVPFHVQALESENEVPVAVSPAEDMMEQAEVIQPIDIPEVEFVTESRIEYIPYETTEIGVDTIPKGSVKVIEEGREGELRRTYLVKYVDGVKVDETLYTEFPMSSPVNAVANVGVGGTVTAQDGTVYEYNYRKEVEATAYTYMPPYTSMTTATGETLRKGIVAVDPKVIPLHTKMFITNGKIEYGLGVAEDTGGAIKGDKIDLAYMSYDECIQFGRRKMTVYILD